MKGVVAWLAREEGDGDNWVLCLEDPKYSYCCYVETRRIVYFEVEE